MQVNEELVSIMMPAFNAESFIGDAINSVLEQSYPHWELLIVNDGSTDRTREVIAGFQDDRIHVFAQPNMGEAAARNVAIRNMRGEFLAFLDADDQFLAEHLELAVKGLSGRYRYGGIYTDGYYIDEEGRRLEKLSARRRGPFQGNLFEELVRASDVFGPPTCTVLRSDLVVFFNLRFDTQIVIGPDWDFMTRFASIGEFTYIDQPTCCYRMHETNITKTTRSLERRRSLSRCREKAIKLDAFDTCSVRTRSYAFYDLLINYLGDQVDKQIEITRWEQFNQLPGYARARLYRLMASHVLSMGGDLDPVAEWYQQALTLAPYDLRNMLLAGCFRLHPDLCRELVRLRKSILSETTGSPHFDVTV